MALKPDDTVCYCFHVPLRKIEAFCRIEKPAAASQISDCLSAGTGCGWCCPMLRQIHLRICGDHIPWWREPTNPPPDVSTPATAEPAGNVVDPELPDQDAANYAAGRRAYLAAGKGKPPPEAQE